MPCKKLLIASLMFYIGGLAADTGGAWIEKSTGMPFMNIPKGCFQMGSDAPIPPPWDPYWTHVSYSQNINEDEFPKHQVCIDAFWMGKYEVRLTEWQKIMGTPNDSIKSDPSVTVPIGDVTWQQAQEFARRLTSTATDGSRFRLPTEAEWEYACRAGSKEEVHAAPGQAWIATQDYAEAVPHPVGTYTANDFGLHDMLGNMWEWVADAYQPTGYAQHSLHNPLIETTTKERVIRGGSVRTAKQQARCAMRGHHDSGSQLGLIGFRLVREK